MLVKGQRRRISPRTRRRCLAIRGFFKKALDTCTTTSQFFTKCGSIDNTNNLNKKIIELEGRLNALSKASFDQQIIMEASNIEIDNNSIEDSQELDNAKESTKEIKTELLYKTSENRYKRYSSRPSQNFSEIGDSEKKLKIPEPSHSNISKSRTRKQRERITNLHSPSYGFDHEHVAQNYSVYYQENEQYIKNHRNRKHCSEHGHKRPRNISEFNEEENRSIRHYRKRAKRSKLTKQTSSYINYENNLNPNYIAQIIQNQYEPIDVLDKRVSEISQFSVPICRDRQSQENTSVPINNYDKVTKDVHYEQKIKPKHLRKTEPKNVTHHDHDVYDFIPVKEMSTPTSRRKFVEDQMIANRTHREVPPSPRTNRPRLNLTIKHYTDNDDYQNIVNDNHEMNNGIVGEGSEVKLTSKDEVTLAENYTEYEKFREYETKRKNEIEHSEKPTTTLNEIKETLQRFLQEVQEVKSFHQIPDNNLQQNNGFVASNAGLPMLNSCYYPVVPICPVNYMQSAFVPSNSTCAACTHSNDSEGTVAEQLIKQIHQTAAPERNDTYQKQANRHSITTHQRPLTSRSAGSGRVLNCCDVDVQIPTLKCISNSSATIGSKIISERCNFGPKESTLFDIDELNIKLPSVTSESVMESNKNETPLQYESCRWKRFFKSFGTVKKCQSTRNDASSPQLPRAKLLRHDNPRTMFECKSLSQKSSNEDVRNISPYSNDSHYVNGFYLKEVQVKCVATQSERPKRYLFGLFSF